MSSSRVPPRDRILALCELQRAFYDLTPKSLVCGDHGLTRLALCMCFLARLNLRLILRHTQEQHQGSLIDVFFDN